MTFKRRVFFGACLMFSILIRAHAQMLVYTVAGSDTAHSLGEGGPAITAGLGATEGIWLDGSCNLYISNMGNRVVKVDHVTQILTIAGSGLTAGYSGDGGLATNAKISIYGLFAEANGDILIAAGDRIRKVSSSTGIITTIAGGGSILGDNGPATNAMLTSAANVYEDSAGNIYIGDRGRIRRINTSGIISTFCGTGTMGLSGDGGPATAAQVKNPHTMLFDNSGNFYFADRGNHRVRKIDRNGIVSTFAGTTDGFSGDGGPATAAQLSGPISFVIDYLGNVVIGDNQNNVIRRVDVSTNIIHTIAGALTSGSSANGVPATAADIHPEFMYLDRAGNIYYSCFCNKVRKIINYLPGQRNGTNDCGETAVPIVSAQTEELNIFPNPANNEFTLTSTQEITSITISSLVGNIVYSRICNSQKETVDAADLPKGIYLVRINGTKTRKLVKE